MSYKKRSNARRQRPLANQKKIFWQLVVLIILCSALWLTFFPGTGIISLMKKQAQQSELEQEIAELKAENRALSESVDRLQNDPEYLENEARRRYGLLKENETVYDFTGKDTDEAE